MVSVESSHWSKVAKSSTGFSSYAQSPMSRPLPDSPFLLHQMLSPPTTHSQKAGPAFWSHAQQRRGKRVFWQQVSTLGPEQLHQLVGMGMAPDSRTMMRPCPWHWASVPGREQEVMAVGQPTWPWVPILHSLREQRAGAIPPSPCPAQGQQAGIRVPRRRGGSSRALVEKLLAQHRGKDRAGWEHLQRAGKCGTPLHWGLEPQVALDGQVPAATLVGLRAWSCFLLAVAWEAQGMHGTAWHGMAWHDTAVGQARREE